MKYADSIVFVLVTAAVLITAYGIGLLVKQGRTAAPEALAQPRAISTPADANDGAALEVAGEPNEIRPDAPDPNGTVQEETDLQEQSPDPNSTGEDEEIILD